jgi:hypothetical protein
MGFGFGILKSGRFFSFFVFVFSEKLFFVASTVMLAADIAAWTVL